MSVEVATDRATAPGALVGAVLAGLAGAPTVCAGGDSAAGPVPAQARRQHLRRQLYANPCFAELPHVVPATPIVETCVH